MYRGLSLMNGDGVWGMVVLTRLLQHLGFEVKQ